MKSSQSPWLISGQGLAGTCLAWALWRRGVSFRIVDRGHGGSSRVAAGLINPVTGKNFEPSWRIADFLPDAEAFYRALESKLGVRFWHPLPVVRLAASEKEWRKILAKLENPDVAPWIAGETSAPDGWAGAVELRGGARLDTRTFLDASRDFFREHDCFSEGESPAVEAGTIACEGWTGLLTGAFGPHRCAKGEILTLEAPDWDASRIVIGAGGWLVPIGGGRFKSGSTYVWDKLDCEPTEAGRQRVEEIVRRLGGGDDFQVVAHEAGVRPILRRSQPLIGPTGGGAWMFNALGSKGSLYAPGVAERLAAWLIDGTEPEPELDFRHFSA